MDGLTGTVDLAVVGGGVLGALVAREAAVVAPGARIAVLERGLVGRGASGRSAGVHFPRGATARVRAMTEYSQAAWTRLADELQLPIRHLPATVVSSADPDEVFATYLRLGPAVAPADPALGWSAAEGAYAWTVPGCQHADVAAVAERLLAGVRWQVDVREGTEVSALTSSDGVHLLTLGTGERLRARQVVLAPGPWIGHPAWADLLAPLGVRVKKIVAAHVDRVPSAVDPLVIFHDEDAFLLPLPERGHYLFSYTCQRWDVSPDDPGLALEQADLADARAVLDRYSSALAARCTSGRVFCDAYGPDRAPLVAEIRPGLVYAGGGSGSGYRLAPALAADALAALGLGAPTSTTPALSPTPSRT